MRRSSLLLVVTAITALAGVRTAEAAPNWVRLSFSSANTDTEMTVTWNTDLDVGTEVEYGTSPGNLTTTVTGTSFAGSGAFNFIHEVVLPGLQPDTTYYYRVGDPIDGYSPEYFFTTGPAQDQSCGQFSFIFLADNRPDPIFGGGATYDQILDEAFAHNPEFVLTGGDMVEDGGDISQWITFLDYTANVSAFIAYMPSMGNHDDGGPGVGDTAHYNQLFAMPRATGTGGSNTEDHYFFTYGNAIFVALSTESFTGGPGGPFSDQATWLDNVLTNNPRRWKFVYFHKPIYTHEVSFGASHPPNEENQNAALVPVIDAHHVDFVLQSHNHWYERYEPSACANQGNPGSDEPCSVGAGNYAQGTVYIVSGGAGTFTIPSALCNDFLNPPPPGRVECTDSHHYLRFVIDDETLTLETWGANPQPNQIIDTITITKPTVPCGVPPLPDGGVPDGGGPGDGGTGTDSGAATDSGAGGDATPPGSDAAQPGADAAPGVDSGGQILDAAGPGPDSGPGEEPKGGCSCTTGSSGSSPLLPALFLLFALGLLWRRRAG